MDAGSRTKVQWYHGSPFELFERADRLAREGPRRGYGPNSDAVLELLAFFGSLSPADLSVIQRRSDGLAELEAPWRTAFDRSHLRRS